MFQQYHKKYNITVIILLLSFCLIVPVHSYAKSCKKGVNQCKNHVGKEYRQCIKSVCGGGKVTKKGPLSVTEKINESEGSITGIDMGDAADLTKLNKDKTCKIGLHKCNSLREEQNYYWRCMKNTCASLTGEEEPSCDEGHRQCKFRLDSYWLCMGLTCKTSVTSFDTCDDGINNCSPDLNKYWNCVSRICLGDVTKFRNPDPAADDDDYQEDAPEASKYIIRGVPDKYKYPPKGVDPKEWVSITPPARTMRGPASRTLRCPVFTKSISCRDSSDILTCVCSDGSRPETKPGYLKRNFQEKPF